MSRGNPRAACLEALTRWENGHGHEFADDILHTVLAHSALTALDRAFLTETFYGILRHLSLLDFWIGRLRSEPIDSRTRQLLRAGLYQIFHMRVPNHAAVHETVNLAGRARSIVNALLRKSIREFDDLLREGERAPEEVRVSHPRHLIERWRRSFGAAETTSLCEWNNRPAEIYVRANTLKVSPGELLRSSDAAEASSIHPLMLKVERIPLPWILQGLGYVQDPSTLLACELLAPEPGETVLDACAAPGGKTSYLAQMMGNEGRLVACDASPQRITRLRENLARLHVTNAETRRVNWLGGGLPFAPESFDRILVDAPCSNTGVIRRRIDVRWRLTPADFAAMPETQLNLLRAITPLLRRGGRLVYSTCSLEPEENEGVVERVRTALPELRFLSSRQSLPFRDSMDGAFAAAFERIVT